MPISICPTITAFDKHDYRRQMEVIEPFAKCVHIDLMDGQFAPSQSPPLSSVWWPEEMMAHIHLMYQHPMNYVDELIRLKPNLVIVHYEVNVDHQAFTTRLRQNGIRAGLALLADTEVQVAKEAITHYDQVLIFSGKLGYHGGEADLELLSKLREVTAIKANTEIAWDGGINEDNIKELVSSGVNVLNVGGYIMSSNNPKEAYAKIEKLID